MDTEPGINASANERLTGSDSQHAHRRSVRGSSIGWSRLSLAHENLFQIFRHLHPVDLLSLSRTTRCLRGVLLAKHARSVWRDSLTSVRVLPACPSDLSEPRYASLAFDDVCDVRAHDRSSHFPQCANPTVSSAQHLASRRPFGCVESNAANDVLTMSEF